MPTLTRDLTYAQLVAEIAAGTLNEGEGIWITDYQTVHTIPLTEDTNTGEIEPLFVTALSSNELKPEAYSLAFPDDIIYYNLVNDQSKVTGCTKGYIYRRIDTKQNNDFPFDFRQVKFRRWQIDQPAWDIATEYSKGQVVKHPSNNTLWASLHDSNVGNSVGSNNEHWRQFEWDNLSYVAWNPDYFLNDEVSWYLTPNANYQDYKMFAVDSYYDSTYSNKIEMPYGNLLENSNSVIFGAYFNSNSIGAYFNYNSIGANFNSNSIGAYFYYNSIGANSNSNSIGANFYSNSIGANFYYNSIGANFQSNTVANDFNNITGSASGVDFSAATHVYTTYSCELFKRQDGTPKLKYCNDSDVIVVVDANA